MAVPGVDKEDDEPERSAGFFCGEQIGTGQLQWLPIGTALAEFLENTYDRYVVQCPACIFSTRYL